jgi:hypothetical protein
MKELLEDIELWRSSDERVCVATETAVSALGEILAVRAARPGGRLRDARQRIHAKVD